MFEILENNPLFRGIESKVINQYLSEISSPIYSYEKNDVAYDTYKQARSIMFLLSGSAKVEQHHENGTSTFLKRLKPGDLFGVLSIFSTADDYPTHVVFDKNSQVLRIDEASILELLYKDASLLKNYLTFFNGQVQYLLERIDLFSIQSSEERVVQFLIHLNKRNGKLEMTKVELSEYLGISRATLYRVLDKLVRQNDLEVKADYMIYPLYE